MKTVIENASRGEISFDAPEVAVLMNQIEVEMEAGAYFRGTFDIVSQNGLEFKAVLYSDSDRITIENPQYIGKKYSVKYLVSSETMSAGDCVAGELRLVCSGGEFRIPYRVRVSKPVFRTSVGPVDDYDSFVALVRHDRAEAFKVFDSPKFKDIVIGNRYEHRALYTGLVKTTDGKTAMEEFLIGIEKKEPVLFEVEETALTPDAADSPVKCSVHIKKNKWGYFKINVSVDGGFFKEWKEVVTSDDFVGNSLVYTFLVDTALLHPGKNLGSITFQTNRQTVTVPVTLHSQKSHLTAEHRQKKDIMELMNLYLQFRMQKVAYPVWEAESMALVDRMRSNDDSDVMIRLMKAQMCVIADKRDEAAWLLDYIQKVLPNVRENKIELQGYYLYIRALQRRDADYTRDVVAKLRAVYEQGHSTWQLLWILLYLDERFETNKSLKYTMIKDRCNRGCISPLMYFEAVNVLNVQPFLLRVLNRFEILALTFGAKKKYITLKLATTIAELAMREKTFHKGILQILILLYDSYQNNQILAAICATLIKGNCTDRRYFHWYELAVKNDVKLTKLYEFYLYSIDVTRTELLPQMILMYFTYNTDSIRGRESYLFCNVIKNKQAIPHIYQNYLRAIEQYGIRQILIGNMDEHLAVIYEEILSKSLLTEDIARRLPGMILSQKITQKNPAYKKVVVLHKETQDEKSYPIRDGVAYVKLYTERPVLLFEDSEGVRYCSVDYEKTKLLDMEYYLKLSYEIYPHNKFLRLHYGENYVNFKNNPEKYVSMFKLLMEVDDMDANYKKELMRDIVDYYYNNLNDELMDRYLLKADVERMDASTRQKLVEIMVLRGMYEDAYPILRKYGSGGLAASFLFRFCTRMIELRGGEADESLLSLTHETFCKGVYDERSLTYLQHHYFGLLDDMIAIWRAGIDFDVDVREIEERIMVQGMFVRDYRKIGTVFAHYYASGAKPGLRKAYLNLLGYDGLLKSVMWDAHLPAYLEKECLKGEAISAYNVILLLRSYSEKAALTELQKKIAERLTKELLRKRYYFEFLKRFDTFVTLPGALYEKMIFTHYGKPGADMVFCYRFEGEKAYVRREMKRVLPGVWNEELILFSGDHLSYYIVEEGQPESEIVPVMVTGADTGAQGDSCFALINQMIETKSSSRRQRLKKDYQRKRAIAEALF